MYTLVLRHLSRVHLSRANFLYSHDLSDAQLTWNKVGNNYFHWQSLGQETDQYKEITKLTKNS